MRGLTCALLACVVVLGLGPADAGATTRITPKVIHGSNATIEEAPYQVALLVKGPQVAANHYGQFCGATLVSLSRVVTAAHCVFDALNFGDVYDPGQVEALVGSADLGDTAGGQRRDVVSVAFDRRYEPLTGEHDVAVVTLASDLVVGPTVQAIDAIKDDEVVQVTADKALVISGWGNTSANPAVEQFPRTLQRAVVHLVDDGECGASYTAAGFLFDPQLMLCATATTGSGIIDTCQGDSGGPLAMDVNPDSTTLYRLVGITSFGNGCALAGFPGVYTDLTTTSLRNFAIADHGAPPGPTLRTVAIESAPRVGEPLGCSATAAPAGTQHDGYRWFRYDEMVGIEPASGLMVGDPAYDVTGDDVGWRLICAAQTSNEDGYHWDWGITAAVSQPPPPQQPPAQQPPVQQPPADPVLPPSNPPAVDVLPPVAKLTRVSCRRSSCVIDLNISDPDSAAGPPVVRASVRSSFRATCQKRGKRVRCTKHRSRTLKARKLAPGHYRIQVLLPRGTHRIAVVATDAAGHSTTVRRTVKTR